MKKLILLVAISLFAAGCEQGTNTPTATPSLESTVGAAVPAETGPFQATGFKIGEVTDSEAIIWTRLTRSAKRVGTEAPQAPDILYQAPEMDELQEDIPGRFHPHDWSPVVIYPEGSSIDFIEGAVPGSSGQVRVRYRSEGTPEWQSSEWGEVDATRDFTRQVSLSGLNAAARYEIIVEGRANADSVVSSSFEGDFKTAPSPDVPARVVFAATTGTEWDDQDAPEGGFQMHKAIAHMSADFFVHTGDIVYYDRWAKNIELARWGWSRMFSLATNFDFHRIVPTYFMKDDHDVWQDDTWPSQESLYMGDLTFQDGVEIFKEQVPMDDLTYRTFRWGKDVQIWLVEGRDYRDPNDVADFPGKTIWGKEQVAWFKDTVQASDATFRILISPTPFVGPDIDGKTDSHANDSFLSEGTDLREFMVEMGNMLVICGDRHWQYVSVDDETGLREYATGAASDTHAGAWESNDDVRPEHLYVNIVGGYLSVTVDRVDNVPTLILRNHHVDGEVLFEDVVTLESLAMDRADADAG